MKSDEFALNIPVPNNVLPETTSMPTNCAYDYFGPDGRKVSPHLLARKMGMSMWAIAALIRNRTPIAGVLYTRARRQSHAAPSDYHRHTFAETVAKQEAAHDALLGIQRQRTPFRECPDCGYEPQPGEQRCPKCGCCRFATYTREVAL